MDVSVNSCCCELSFRDSLVIGFPCLFAIPVVRFYHTSVAEYVEAYTSPQNSCSHLLLLIVISIIT